MPDARMGGWGVVNEVAGNVLHGLSDAPRRLVWEVRVGVGGVDVESVPKVERNSWYSVKAVRRPFASLFGVQFVSL